MTEDSMLASQVARDNWTYYVAPGRELALLSCEVGGQ